MHMHNEALTCKRHKFSQESQREDRTHDLLVQTLGLTVPGFGRSAKGANCLFQLLQHILPLFSTGARKELGYAIQRRFRFSAIARARNVHNLFPHQAIGILGQLQWGPRLGQDGAAAEGRCGQQAAHRSMCLPGAPDVASGTGQI